MCPPGWPKGLRRIERGRQAGLASLPTAPEEDIRLERPERLAQLRAAGVIDDEELRAEKAHVLGDEHGGVTVTPDAGHR